MKYETPEMKVLLLKAEDVITLSEGTEEDRPGTNVGELFQNETNTASF